jgi:branched-chain amino acid transport system substrate-binding protein
MKFHRRTLALAAAALAIGSTCALAQKGETVKVAFIDPLSGPFANVGQNQLKSWQFTADRLANNPAGV